MTCYTVNFTETAKSDMRNIALYVAQESASIVPAQKFLDELKHTCEQLQNFPQSGMFPKDNVLRSAGYRYLICKNYLLCYTVDEQNEMVYVQAVFNAARDYSSVLKKML